jgi:diguanylate cyclase (GGDEF)-like protein
MDGVAWRAPLILAVGAAAWTTRAHSVAASTRLLTGMGLAALVCVALGLRQHRVGRPLPDAAGPVEPVLLLGAGLGTLVMSDAVRAIVPVTSTVFVATALIALVGYPVTLTGVVRLVQGRRRGRSGDMVVEAGLLALAFGLCAWALLAHAGQPVPFPVTLAAVALPAADVAVLVVTGRLMSLPGERPESYLYLLIGFLGLFGAHGLQAAAATWSMPWTSPTIEVLRVLAFGAWGAAALHPSMEHLFEPLAQDPPKFSRAHLVLVGIAVVTPAAVALGFRAPRSALTFPVGSAVLAVVIAAHVADLLWDRASVEHRAEHDGLTGLPNRTLLDDRLSRALAHARRSGTVVALLFLDLDEFKAINDRLGHATGDLVLRAVAARIAELLREEDTVARLGGDEFVVLLPHLSAPGDAIAVAQRLLAAFEGHFDAGTYAVRVTPSIGVAVYPDDAADASALLTAADSAMYQAKDVGRGGVAVYSAELHALVQARADAERRLLRAIENDELELRFQPKVSLHTGAVMGAEALVRWRHPDRGVLGPGEFITLAEDTGLITALGERVLELACEQAQIWSTAGVPGLPLAVNLSPRQFVGSPLAALVASALRRHQLPGGALELEVTETAALDHLELTVSVLEDIRAMGVRCAIDDFGTGYSSLSHLTKLPIDVLKIDRSFVNRIGQHNRGESIVAAVIAMAHGLGLSVVAEGVETTDQLAFLHASGCDQVQGFLFSPPLSAARFEALVRSQRVRGPGQLPDCAGPVPEHQPAVAAG